MENGEGFGKVTITELESVEEEFRNRGETV